MIAIRLCTHDRSKPLARLYYPNLIFGILLNNTLFMSIQNSSSPHDIMYTTFMTHQRFKFESKFGSTTRRCLSLLTYNVWNRERFVSMDVHHYYSLNRVSGAISDEVLRAFHTNFSDVNSRPPNGHTPNSRKCVIRGTRFPYEIRPFWRESHLRNRNRPRNGSCIKIELYNCAICCY